MKKWYDRLTNKRWALAMLENFWLGIKLWFLYAGLQLLGEELWVERQKELGSRGGA